MTLTPQQQAALDRITDFIKAEGESVFILKGYAGTGKTTLIKNMLPILHDAGKMVALLAPTGRAAKVLSEKTEQPAFTIHRFIYNFQKMDVKRHNDAGDLLVEAESAKRPTTKKSDEGDELQFWFAIRESSKQPHDTVLIVDEASMVSSRKSANENLHFGTDVLIDDLLTFVKPQKGGKVIFVGDPAQLPPVGDNRSVALDAGYFEQKNITARQYELTDVLRQRGESAILENATAIRHLLEADRRTSLCFKRKDGEVADITHEDVVRSFTSAFPHPEIGNSVVVCYTNAMVSEYNNEIRHRYYPQRKQIVVGDILQIVHNTVNRKKDFRFFNGDFVKVADMSDNVERKSAPVWIGQGENRKKVTVSLDFRDVTLITENGDTVHCKIIDSMLGSHEPRLTPYENVALYIDFKMRHPHLKESDKSFGEMLMDDDYYNAVQAKYGYAITGHRAQGGEWDTVYVDYSGRNGLNNDSLRWAYTATTRASRMLYGVNMPQSTPMSALKCDTIKAIKNLPKEAYAFATTAPIEGFPALKDEFQKQKYRAVKEHLDNHGLMVTAIQPLQYCDRYSIEGPEGCTKVDCFYNGAGIYTRYHTQPATAQSEMIAKAFEDNRRMLFAINYQPSEESFKMLHQRMLTTCDDLGITITNIVEHRNQYFVAYYLVTSGKFSQIQFFFNSSYAFTHAMPSSDMGQNDVLLQQLVDALQNSVQ